MRTRSSLLGPIRTWLAAAVIDTPRPRAATSRSTRRSIPSSRSSRLSTWTTRIGARADGPEGGKGGEADPASTTINTAAAEAVSA